MATRIYLTNTPCDVTVPGTETLLAVIGTKGAALSTGVADTVASGTSVPLTRTAGGTQIRWLTAPLSPVTIAALLTINLWMSENNMSANVGSRLILNKRSKDGQTTVGSTFLGANRGIELAVTPRAVNNYTATPTSTAVATGERIEFIVAGANVGTMAAGFTFDAGWGGTTDGADGDTWVEFAETITAFSAGPPDMTRHNTYRQLARR